MALEEFEKDQYNDREKNYIKMKSITNYVMGVFIIGVGFLFLFPPQQLNNFFSKYDPAMLKLFAILCFIYGLFRMYRGYAKNYFRE